MVELDKPPKRLDDPELYLVQSWMQVLGSVKIYETTLPRMSWIFRKMRQILGVKTR